MRRPAHTGKGKERKGKEEYLGLYSAILADTTLTKRSDMDHTVLQITPCLPFPCKRSPDGATRTEVADI